MTIPSFTRALAETSWTDVRCYVHETERVNHALSTSAGVPIERRRSGDFNIGPSGETGEVSLQKRALPAQTPRFWSYSRI
jgi:hypothetical protein